MGKRAQVFILGQMYTGEVVVLKPGLHPWLTGDQTAQVLGISPKTVDRHWVYARAWLRREVED